MKIRHTALAFAIVLAFGQAQADTSANDLASRRAALNALLQEQWEYALKLHPEMATALGDARYNGQWSNLSPAAISAAEEADKAFLKRFEAIDVSGFPEQEKLNRDLMVRELKLGLEGARFKDWEMPLLQNGGPHIDAPQLMSIQPLVTVHDYENYIARLRSLPTLFAQVTDDMKLGMRDHLMPPQFLIPKIVAQCDSLGGTVPEKSPFAVALKTMPETFSAKDKVRLRAAVLQAIRHDVNPAYKKLAGFIKTRYLPEGRKEPGVWSLPDGGSRYAYAVKTQTTTDMTPAQIHELGLAEVSRIEAQMLAVAQKLGFADLKSFHASFASNPHLHVKTRQEMLDLYAKYVDQMTPKLPQLFNILPKAKLEVKPVEEFEEDGAAGASYRHGTPDGTRPGYVMINTSDVTKRVTTDVETTALHEGIPGHHMQISIAQELRDLPPFRAFGDNNAYAEGWALYAERLGEDLGFYSDPYSYYGHLEDEMLRAIRLVVDTGLHDKKWSRQQVVDYFHEHSGFDEVDVQSETDRYIVWPGQALGYKIGQLKILELRDYAKKELGAQFDIRKFHDAILGAGALPLDVLETRVKDWVVLEKQAKMSSTH